MKKSKLKIFATGVITLGLLSMNVANAASTLRSNIKTYTIDTPENIITTDVIVNGGTVQYSRPSSTYSFFDEDGRFNNVYAGENTLYWSIYDEDMNVISTAEMPMLFDKSHLSGGYEYLIDLCDTFGNAIYHEGYLYVVYAQRGTKATSEYMAEVTMKLAKYNNEGELVKVLDMPVAENSSSTDWKYGPFLPFFPNSNCSLAISTDGILGCFYGTTYFNSHSGSQVFFVDISGDEFDWVSNRYYASAEDKTKWANIGAYFNSHSMAQRIIPTTDGGFLLADNADATYRGTLITKTLLNEQTNVMDLLRCKMIHYREGSMGSNGYNNTYMAMGNLIELDDGYMYIGSMEKTLDMSFGKSINESWELFVQKYDKDFMHMTTIEEMQLFNTPTRNITMTGELPDTTKGRAYLKGTEVDYGIKYLTNQNNKSMIYQVRAVELDNDDICIIYYQMPIKESYVRSWGTNGTYEEVYNGYSHESSKTKTYYMIIDKDANILSESIEVPDVSMSQEELYAFNDGKIYWTTSTSKNNSNITVNVLDVYNPIEYDIGDVNMDGLVNVEDSGIIMDYYKGTIELDEKQLTLADMDGNGLINVEDAGKVLDKFKGLL